MAAIINIQWNNLNRVLNEFADFFIQQARQNLGLNESYASGNLGDTMEKIIEIDYYHFSVKISLADYWDYVENGRKPGKFPPPNRIKEWISVKPVSPRPLKNGKLPTTSQLAYLIGRKIAQEGTEPKPFFKPAKEAAISQFKDAITYAVDEDVAEWITSQVTEGEIYEDLFKAL